MGMYTRSQLMINNQCMFYVIWAMQKYASDDISAVGEFKTRQLHEHSSLSLSRLFPVSWNNDKWWCQIKGF